MFIRPPADISLSFNANISLVWVDSIPLQYSQRTSVTTQYFAQYVESSRPIKWSIYDLSDGRIEVYVCVEMLQSEDASLQNLINELNNDDLINSKPERDKIINELKKSLDSYREQLSK